MRGTASVKVRHPLMKRRWVRVVLWIFGILVFLLVSALVGGYWFISRSHPVLEGTGTMPQLQQEVTVLRDERGVAQINAGTLEDLFFIQGYVMAQDRLFQMDMTRRLAGGRLSEVIGEDTLEVDRFYRTFGMHRATAAVVEKFDAEASIMVESYAAGVNAYIEEAFAAGRQPVEFRILGYDPDPWTAEDSVIVAKYMGYTLSGDHRNELMNYRVARALGEHAQLIFPDYMIADFPLIYELSEVSPFSDEELEELAAFAPAEFQGSNNWAISGEHAESGFPLVANDPHLAFGIPNVWYQTHLNLEGDFNSIGVTVPGVPGVVLGHNGYMAWGVTAMSVDQEDLYLEQFNPENPQLYLFDGKWEEATVIEEEIYVDGVEEPYIEVVEITRNGPIINKVIDEGPYQAISLRWTGLEPGEEFNGILKLSRSTNMEEFIEGMEGFVTPALSWVFADREGNIGYRGQALLPVRQNSTGVLPVPGWDPAYQWDGFIPGDELPQIYNPERGYIMTANNRPAGEDYPYEIGKFFFPYRAERLDELIQGQIASGDAFTLEQMKEMQLDILNTQARALAPVLTDAVVRAADEQPLSAIEQDALNLLQGWDYVEDAASAETLVWHQWYNLLGSALFEEMLGFPWNNFLVIHHVLVEADQDPGNVLFAFLPQGYHLSLDEVARQTFAEAIEEVIAIQGNNPDRWEWGKWHRLTVRHPIGSVWPLNYLFNVGEWGLGGSGNTPKALFADETGQILGGGGWRFVSDLSSVEESYDIIMPGQSGQVFSPHYKDQIEGWVQGELYPMIYEKEGSQNVKRKVFTP
ncbi:penicillin acylase family protein [Dethiobacter alkaliphilus]|uniref:Peptidase S45 penicillin amidase n=1 Tax=Dethiobacter alkaliphilus AHT 1 TaxID=555088 RepID=C0GKT7_DETAL|nr:penicillin acylase family protein [Dethiobacter alkaliphilus]EEG76056.1 peptidase S45 penicillin amidase [Dethiobacter alkaliphilus AHT 1]